MIICIFACAYVLRPSQPKFVGLSTFFIALNVFQNFSKTATAKIFRVLASVLRKYKCETYIQSASNRIKK